ncbi:MAG: alpha/beta fold hydrolase [Beijerinckiaceae bacterium]|nr:alpha/beta fold hydrolase [Beijerinckiaceae bacterium]
MSRTSASRLLALWLLAASLSAPASALERETVPVTVEGTTINAYLYLPEGKGPFPLLVMSHGSPRDGNGRSGYGAGTLSAEAKAFAESGVAVAVPVRRGYGGIGEWAEAYGPCDRPDYYRAGVETARDIRATVAALKQRRDIDPARIALIGHSAGGFGSVAAGAGGGVRAIVNFAGGRGSRGPDDVCAQEKLVEAMSRYGASSRAPELWVYSQNDHFFGPDLARRMHAAFTSAGGKATFIAAPAYGSDGHHYFGAVSSWKPEVDAFLKRTGILK